jgi:hypothetical protein
MSNNDASSTFLNDATLTTMVLGCIHSVGNRYDFAGTPVMTMDDYMCIDVLCHRRREKEKKQL